MRTIKLIAEYGAFPIWRAEEEAGDGDPELLPLPDELKLDLNAWARAI